MTGYTKCLCEHCGGHVEFPAEAAGRTVPCPHCNQAITLTPSPDTSRSRRPWMVGVAIALALIASGSAAAWYHFKHTAPPSAPAAATPIATTAPGSLPDAEFTKTVVPVLAPYQSGLTAAQIRVGREVYVNKCSECHRFFDPASFGGEEWGNIISKMRGKAKLTSREAADLDRFIQSIRSSGT